MKKSVLVVVGLVLTCGCESFRHQYVPEASSAPSTRRKYSLKSCNVYEFSKRVKENHRSIMNARSFAEEELLEMQKAYPEVFSADGVPVSIRLCYDMDRFEAGNPFLGVVDVLFFLGTVGVVPLVSASDEFVEVELVIDQDKKTPRVGVTGSSRCVIWTLGLNLLFPFDEPTDARFSKSGRACIGMSDETHSYNTDKRCRAAAYAYAIAVSLAEYEKAENEKANGSRDLKRQEDAKPKVDAVEIEDIPL